MKNHLTEQQKKTLEDFKEITELNEVGENTEEKIINLLISKKFDLKQCIEEYFEKENDYIKIEYEEGKYEKKDIIEYDGIGNSIIKKVKEILYYMFGNVLQFFFQSGGFFFGNNILKENEIKNEKKEEIGGEQGGENFLGVIGNKDDYNLVFEDFEKQINKIEKKGGILLTIILDNDNILKVFVKEMLCFNIFISLFNKKNGLYKDNIIFVGDITKSLENQIIMEQYHIEIVPLIFVISGFNKKEENLSVIYKSSFFTKNRIINDPVESAKEIVSDLELSLESFKFTHNDIKTNTIFEDRLIKREQQYVYNKSLEQDRLKKEKKNLLMELEKQKKLYNSIKINFFYTLLRDDFFFSVTLNSNSSSIRLSLNLPDGKKIIEFFRTDLSFNSLYLFVALKIFVSEICSSQDSSYQNFSSLISNISFLIADSLVKNPPFTLSIQNFSLHFPFKFNIIQPISKKCFPPSELTLENSFDVDIGASLIIDPLDDDLA